MSDELKKFQHLLAKYGDCREWLGELNASDARPSRIQKVEADEKRFWEELCSMVEGMVVER